MVAAYLSFALGSANYSAQSFRYIAASVITEALFLGIYMDRREAQAAGPGKGLKCIQALCVIFSVSSACTYILLGFAR
jgi:hypothetical protein